MWPLSSLWKEAPEIQYLKTSIDEQQRREFGQLVNNRESD